MRFKKINLTDWKTSLIEQEQYQRKVNYTFLRKFFLKIIFNNFDRYLKNNCTNINLGSGRGQINSYIENNNFINIDPIFNEIRLNKDIKICSIGENLPIKNNSVDTIIMNSVLHNLLNIEKTFSEIKRILKKKGILVFQEALEVKPNKSHIHYINLNLIKKITEKNNFTFKKIRMLGNKKFTQFIINVDNKFNNIFVSILLIPFFILSIFLPDLFGIKGYIFIGVLEKQ